MKHFTRKQIAIILIAGGAFILGAAAYFFFKSGPSERKKTTPKAALTVTTTTPSATSLPVRLSANGSIAAWQEAIIGSEVNGLRLLAIRANVGDRVKTGQVLATFALETVQAELAQSRAVVAEAEANALDAAANAEKARTLQASGALSEQQINQYSTAEKTAKARLEAAQASLAVQQVKLKQTQLLAPDNGVISARSATVGSVVASGTELFRMIRGGRLEWRAEVTSAELGRIKAGTPVTLLAANGAQIRGQTRMVGPTVDPLTRSALVYVDLPMVVGAEQSFKAGMFARGEFELGATDSLTLPQRAIVVRDGFNYVFRLVEGMHVSQVKVQTGRLAGDRVEIVSGLPADARVAVDGAGFLNDGDVVRINEKNELNRPAAQYLPTSAAMKSGASQ